MKLAAVSLACLTAIAGAADNPRVPIGFLGTWVSSAADCNRKGSATLVISENTVEAFGSHGFINAVTTTKPQSIEVIFRTAGVRATSRNVYTFALSPDGTRLLQLRGAEVAATRTKCEVEAH